MRTLHRWRLAFARQTMLQDPLMCDVSAKPAMMDTGIPPRSLHGKAYKPGQWQFRLPLLSHLKRDGRMCIFVAEDTGPAPKLAALDRAGTVLATVDLLEGEPCALFLPTGTRRLALHASTSQLPRLGIYPTGKVELKLHAFLHGQFEDSAATRRWNAAGAAARTLRGALTALAETSGGGMALTAARYQQYRARFVEDFTTIPATEAAPRLAFISAAGDTSAKDLLTCAQALARQNDKAFEWIIALPPHRAEEAVALSALLRPALPVMAHPPVQIVHANSADMASQFQAALVATQGGLICPLDPTGRPTRDAVAMLRDAFASHPDCALVYTDEERLDANSAPLRGIFKPAFNTHLLYASNYIGSFFALSRPDALRLGFNPAAESACLFDLLLRHTSMLAPNQVRHIPRIAYGAQTPSHPGFTADTQADAAAALERTLGVSVEHSADGRHLRPLFPLPAHRPLVSIVIPTRDRADLLGMALRTLIARTTYHDFEIIIVDNGSVQPETFALFEETQASWPQTRVVRDDGDFNFPRICNAGVDAARGELILLLNNDIEVIDGDWLSEMVSLSALPRAGVVGAKLLYPDRTVQHAGVIAGLFRYAGHWFAHAASSAGGCEDRLLVRQNLSAVTGACLLIRREVWNITGPLDAERFAEDCNDIDLCLRARAAGFDVVFTPHTGLIHHESVSRGKKRSKAHRERLKAQRARMEERWGTSKLVDPHYNPNLDRKSLYAVLSSQPEGPREPRTDAITGHWRPRGTSKA